MYEVETVDSGDIALTHSDIVARDTITAPVASHFKEQAHFERLHAQGDIDTTKEMQASSEDSDWILSRGACYRTETVAKKFFPTSHDSDDENKDTGDRMQEKEVKLEKKRRIAKAICEKCVVRVECLNYAIETKQENGIWGGVNFEVGAERKPYLPKSRIRTKAPDSA